MQSGGAGLIRGTREIPVKGMIKGRTEQDADPGATTGTPEQAARECHAGADELNEAQRKKDGE